ncbi:unnamed protein product, partial [Amoebophrya sp. A25]
HSRSPFEFICLLRHDPQHRWIRLKLLPVSVILEPVCIFRCPLVLYFLFLTDV